MMKRLLHSILATVLALCLLPSTTFAQTAPTITTLSAGVADGTVQTVSLTSATGFTASTQAVQSYLLVDKELMLIRTISGSVATVTRGRQGTIATGHASGATVVTGPDSVFVRAYSGVIKPGSSAGYPTPAVLGSACTSTNERYLPLYDALNGRRYNCIGGSWMADNGLAYLPPSACVSSVSGNATGTQGLTTAGTSLTPVMQAQTNATGTNTHTYVCDLNAAVWGGSTLSIARNVVLIDAVFFYGTQTTALGTQVATLASGTMNSATVFSGIAFPTSAASETASTVAPVRADAGTLTITPAVASFNTGTTTAGGFFSVKFTPATPFAMNTDLKEYLLTVALLNTATSATITNTPGVLVHFAYVPDSM